MSLRYAPLPKATYLKLKPTSSDYLRWSNQKAVLETAIKEYATLTLDSIIRIHFGGQSHTFTVVELQPEPFSSIIDTDVTLDMEEDVPLNFDTMQTSSSEIPETKKEEPEEDEDNKEEPKDDDGEPLKDRRRKRRRKRGEEAVEDDEPVEKPKGTSFSGQGRSLGSAFTNSPHSLDSSVKSSPPEKSNGNSLNNTNIDTTPSTSDEIPPDSSLCGNCKKYISNRAFRMHEPFCLRNNYCCELCGEVMQKAKKEIHMEEKHKDIPCKDCGKEMEPPKMENHLENECPKRKILCDYCMLKFDADKYEEHATPCGSRTDKCDKCGDYVRLRDFAVHLANNCATVQQPIIYEPVPDDASDLHFCPYCFAPFTDYELLVNHMTSRFTELIESVTLGISEDLVPILIHLGEITIEEDILTLVESLLYSKAKPECIEIVLNHGTIKPNVRILKNNESLSLIQVAIKNRCYQALPVLLKFELDINEQDSNGNTPLHILIDNGEFEGIIPLLKYGADCTIKNNDGFTPFAFVFESTMDNDSKISSIKEFIMSGKVNDENISRNNWGLVKEAIARLLLSNYTSDDSNIKEIQQFLTNRPSRQIAKVQNGFEIKVRKSYKEHINLSVDSGSFVCTLKNETLELELLNSGTLATNISIIYPQVDGIFFSSIPEFKLEPNEERTIKITCSGTEDQQKLLIGNIIVLACKNPSVTGAFYCNVLIQQPE